MVWRWALPSALSCLLILQHDLNYDKHYANHERIYRVGGHLQATGVEIRGARSARELGDILREEFPEAQALTRANNWDHVLVKYEHNGEDIAYYEEDVVRTDSTYFNVFKHNFIKGDEKTCLNLLNSVVITESMVKRYFGNDDPIDKSLFIDGELWKVTAVIEDLPENTHLKFDILLSGLSKITRRGPRKKVVKLSLKRSGIPDVYSVHFNA